MTHYGVFRFRDSYRKPVYSDCRVCTHPDTSRTPSPEVSPVSPKEQYTFKAQVYDRLTHLGLRNLPAGFPFHNTLHHGAPVVSESSYEFNEEFEICGEPRIAKFAYSRPAGGRNHSKSDDYYTWRIYLPTHRALKHRRGQGHSAKYAAAQVQVPYCLMSHHKYGRILRRDPSIILQALAASLDLGQLITIAISDAKTLQSISHSNLASGYYHGDIVYIGTGNNGLQHVLYNATRNCS
ncbi:hypothetical protein FISHEDRAFT_74183 [Fistulina hepatica ATCC 64428]|uniref:Uncharacterized protein n=1 Tax=Fistulina hepatica ATCC 64428 TaxID=1128425 RepID=A0A0D7AD61_9AGAR|nr:hypothetical protein FISHEDRAFT_74183 [Fistulina hepatica ATCC 64428]